MGSGQGTGELRLRVEGSFTGSELRELVRKWGLVSEPSWDRSSADLVRGLLREADRTFGTAELVRRLRVEKPLTEWPDVESGDAEKWGPKSTTQMDLGAPLELADSFATSDAGATDVTVTDAATLGAPPSSIPDLDTTLAATDKLDGVPAPDLGAMDPIGSTGGEALRAPSEAAPASSGVRSQAPESRPLKSGLPFSGTTAVPDPKVRTGIDPKILVLVAGLMFGLAVVAFGAGLLWSRKPTAPVAEGPKVAATVRTKGLAGRASQVLDAELLGVASRCEIDVDGSPSSEILASAQEGCGRSVREARRRIANGGDSAPLSPDRPRPKPSGAQNADDPRPPRAQGGGPPQRPACITACAGSHSSCMSGCGAEPGDASKFDVWQACSGRCLAAESRCRLSCR